MIKVTYGILVQFEESAISDFVPFDMDVDHIDDIDLYTHAEVCAQLLNEYCSMKQQSGTLLKFECENIDLTKQMNQILVKH